MPSSHDRIVRDILSRAGEDPLTRLYVMTAELARLVVRTGVRDELLEGACRIAVETGGFTHASVGLIHEGDGTLSEAARHGLGLEADEVRDCLWQAVMPNLGNARSAGHAVFPNLTTDERFARAVPVLNRTGIRCGAALVLRVHGRVQGLFALFARARDNIADLEFEWLERAATDLGSALEGIAHDGARRRAEDALSRSERQFQEILERVSLIALVLGPDGRVTFCNEFGARLLGCSREEVIGKDWFESFLPPDNRGLVRRLFFDNFAPGSVPVHYYNEITPQRGVRRMVSWSNSVLRAPAGDVVGIASIGEDITERRAAEEALRDSEARYRFLFNANPLPMWILDTDTMRFLAANEAAVKQYGYSRQEFLAMRMDDLHVSEDVREPAGGFSGLPGSSVHHRRKDGSIVHVEVHGFEIMHGARSARLVAAQDVSTMKQLEEQLRQSQKMEAIGRLAGGVAHDFNNLLMAIKGYTELTLAGLAPDHANRTDLEEVLNAAQRGAELTRQLLAFSRRQILKPEILDLNSVVAEVQRMLLRIIGVDIQLVTRFDPHLCRVRADRGQIGQVLLNLVVNARDAMPQGGRLVIETSNVQLDEEYARIHGDVVPGRYAMISVADTGTGIPTHVRAHIFEPFFTTKEKDRGSGLGLSTVYGIVRQSGGHIRVNSEVGHGATFKIYMPDVQLPIPRSDVPPPPVRPRGGSETVLVVEDDIPLRALTRRLLEQFGYRVREASGSEEAIAIVQEGKERVDLLLADLILPTIRGPDLARELQEMHPGLRVLYISGSSESMVLDATREEAAFVSKPFTPDLLAARVREVLDQP